MHCDVQFTKHAQSTIFLSRSKCGQIVKSIDCSMFLGYLYRDPNCVYNIVLCSWTLMIM